MAALGSKMRMAEECDYRQLYLDCKKNVSLFMRQVDAELSAVLNAHEQEKNSLRAEIDRLKSQIAQQPASGRARTNSTCTQSTSSRHTGDSVGKLSLFDRNTLCSELYQSEPNSFIYSTNSPLSRLHTHKGNGKENGKEK